MSSERPPALTSPIQNAGAFAAVCAGLFVLVVLITVAAMQMFPGQPSSSHRLIARFAGQNDGFAGPFTVEDEWEFRWTHNGHLLGILWRRPDGFEDLLMEMPGKPIRYHGGVDCTEGGEYTFEVKGTGDWTLEVYQF